MPGGSSPIGAILAGGSGRRIGGSKAVVTLNRRPLISYPLEAIGEALGEVVVVAKADTELPTLPGVTVWIEPDPRRHPVVGLRHALELAEGRAVLTCAADLPLLTPELIGHIAATDPGPTRAVVAHREGQMHPLLGCYQPSSLAPLRALSLRHGDAPLRRIVGELEPLPYEVRDSDALFNVNTPDDLLQAAAMLDRRHGRTPQAQRYPNVKS